MIDHLIFNDHKFYPDTQVIKDYVDTSLIGKSITYSKYKIGWLKVPGGYVSLNNFDDSVISWATPSDVDNNIASTGEILGISMAKNKTTYYTVWFDHTVNSGTGDGLYRMLIKASDIMKQNMSGNGL
ncbi:hypothetical protein LA20531_01450 [Lactobacillus amylovorus DSM 20531]|uniref:hypothetical protein n=1 Tax=Lactobacillus amylovorus TaxID=1604 RepID=UPI0006F17704|nr:hypothetical protein [Lactobacillus amylovorus]ATO52444.1 hypothetical protein LA20531_01450 [Lactobacillus amylovorus DSM 20531]KRK43063.1 hypothetical protein FC63_GL000376 [Lactobacillus amylovorus DSM 20531]MCT3591913.1 hypothetical protein [Lactobacillus amylovorus]